MDVYMGQSNDDGQIAIFRSISPRIWQSTTADLSAFAAIPMLQNMDLSLRWRKFPTVGWTTEGLSGCYPQASDGLTHMLILHDGHALHVACVVNTAVTTTDC